MQVTPADIPADFWAAPYVSACIEGGLVAGYPDGTYQPELPVSRDQMAVYIARALAGGDQNVPTGPATASFGDVPLDYWAYPYIEYAKSRRIVQGYSDGYRPTERVTRAQMAVYIARAMVSPTGDDGLARYVAPAVPSFVDVPADYWSYRYIECAKAHLVAQGHPDGYHPEEVVTRAQMAVYVARAWQLPIL